MNNHEIMTKGINLLDSMLEGDIEEAIEALERALEAYKLILKYKRAMKGLPTDLVDGLKPKIDIGSANEKIYNFLKKFPDGVENKDIIIGTNVLGSLVSDTLHRRSDLYERIRHGFWKLRDGHALHNNEMEPRKDAVGDHSLQSPL